MSYFHCDNAGAWHQYTTQQCAAIESGRSSGKAVVLPGTADMMEVRFDEEAVTSQGNLAFTKMIQVSGLSFTLFLEGYSYAPVIRTAAAANTATTTTALLFWGC